MKMKKHLSSLLLMLLLVLMLASCAGAGTEEETPLASETTEETSTVESKDAKYDVNEFVGLYSNGRGGIDIQADENNNMTVEIHWSSSAAEWSEWTMHGTFDASTATLEYSDAVKVNAVADSNGNTDSKEVYNNGSGRFIFKQENNQTSLVWEDDVENAGADSDWIRSE